MCGAHTWVEELRHSRSNFAHDLGLAARRAAQIAGADLDAPLLREAEELSIFPGVPLS
jgi:hypothetical protein